MTSPTPHNITPRDLEAYLDGELPPARRAEIESALQANPSLRAHLAQLSSLADATRRAFPPDSTDLPADLLHTINRLADNELPATPAPRFSPFRLAVACGSLAALLVVAFLTSSLATPSATPVATTSPAPTTLPALPLELVSAITRQHLACSAIEDHFLAPDFPRPLSSIAPAANIYLGHPFAAPDLTPLGYAYAGAGPCSIPGGKTLHLLYRSAPTKTAISLFIQPWSNQAPLQDGQQLIAAGPDAAHPMLLWRQSNLALYLIGDDFSATNLAAKSLGHTFAMR